MSDESHIQSVNRFRDIKRELGCDDLTAAILTLAQSVSWIDVNVQISEDGYPERLGQHIADAIENVTKDGAINVTLDGEVLNSVRGAIDVSGQIKSPSKPMKPVKASGRRKRTS